MEADIFTYSQMWTFPWNLIQIGLGLLTMLPLLLKNLRSMSSLTIELLQILMLSALTGSGLSKLPQQLLFTTQFSHFKLLDFAVYDNGEQALNGYFTRFLLNSAYIFVVMAVLLTLKMVCSLFSLTTLGDVLSRLFLRLILLVFLPVVLFSLIMYRSLDTERRIENWISGLSMALYLLAFIGLTLKFLKQRSKKDISEGDKKPSAILEYRNGLKFGNFWAAIFTTTLMPLGKLALAAWIVLFQVKGSSSDIAFMSIISILMLVAAAIIRPYRRTFHNVFLIVGLFCVLAILNLNVISSAVRTLGSDSKVFGEVLVGLLLSAILLLSLIAIFFLRTQDDDHDSIDIQILTTNVDTPGRNHLAPPVVQRSALKPSSIMNSPKLSPGNSMIQGNLKRNPVGSNFLSPNVSNRMMPTKPAPQMRSGPASRINTVNHGSNQILPMSNKSTISSSQRSPTVTLSNPMDILNKQKRV